MKSMTKITTFIFLTFFAVTESFITPWFNRLSTGKGQGIPPPPPSDSKKLFQSDDSGDDHNSSYDYRNILASSLLSTEAEQNDHDLHKDDLVLLCDASGSSFMNQNGKDIVAGAKATFDTSFAYWSSAWSSLILKVQAGFRKLVPLNKQEEDEIDPSTVPVQNVIVTGSQVLPDSVVRAAGQRSGMIGSVLEPSRVNECAKHIKTWYNQKGYVLHSVTGATLHVDNGTATLAVQEPILASMPVDIRFAKEVPIDPDSGQTTTLRRYKEKLERRKARPLSRDEWMNIKSSLNTTLITSEGRTNPNKISKRLDLHPGDHFRWNNQRWQNIAQSGIFSKIWRASPVQMNDGTVQLQVLAEEAPPRNLEYGITKSLYTGHWEGELDFKHENLLGGGESLGLIVRRGAKDPEPTIIVRFTDDKFGLDGGYDVEIFTDNLSVDNDEVDISQSKVEEDSLSPSIDTTSDSPLNRRGMKLSLRGPIPTRIIRQNAASMSLERTMTKLGRHESIGSGTIVLGPFVRVLPLGARTSITTTTTSGARLMKNKNNQPFSVLPYTSSTILSRQVFPLLTDLYSTINGGQIKLALQESIFSATSNLPHHEAIAAGNIARVRGDKKSNGSIDASITGSAEIRIPISVPLGKDSQDTSVVLFADWMGAKHKYSSGFDKNSMFKKSSYGVGIRKSVQGIPLKYDVSFNRDGKVGHFLGLGFDWDL